MVHKVKAERVNDAGLMECPECHSQHFAIKDSNGRYPHSSLRCKNCKDE